MDVRFRRLIHKDPTVAYARYMFLEAVADAGEDSLEDAQDWWEKHFARRPKYHEWLDNLDRVDVEETVGSRYQLEQQAPDDVDHQAIAAYWKDQFPDKPLFDPEVDTIAWLTQNPKMCLLTERAFLRRIQALGGTKEEAREAWANSKVKRVRLHFRTTQTRIIRAQAPQLMLHIIAPPGFFMVCLVVST